MVPVLLSLEVSSCNCLPGVIFYLAKRFNYSKSRHPLLENSTLGSKTKEVEHRYAPSPPFYLPMGKILSINFLSIIYDLPLVELSLDRRTEGSCTILDNRVGVYSERAEFNIAYEPVPPPPPLRNPVSGLPC